MNNSKNIWVWAVVGVIIIAAIIWGISAGSNGSKTATSTPEANSTSTAGVNASSSNPVSSGVSSSVTASKPALLQDNPYVNRDAKFSIFLPKKWGVQDSATSSTASNTWFYDTSVKKEDTAITMVVGRFERTDKMNDTIGKQGGDAFLDAIANSLSSDMYKYTLNSTSTVKINGVTFRKYYGTYLGVNSGKQAVQSIYLTLTDKAYYMIGVDCYTGDWETSREKMMASVSTFSLLP